MSEYLTNVKLKTSKSVYIGCIIMWLLLLILIKFSALNLITKLLYLLFSSVIIYSTCLQFHRAKFDKCDVLVDINTVICWRNNNVMMYTFQNWYSLAGLCIFIKMTSEKKTETMIIAKDSCDKKNFNSIMRQIRWRRQINNQ